MDVVNKVQIQEKWEPNLSSTFWDRYGLHSFIRFHSGSPKDDGTATTDRSSISGGTSPGTGAHGGPPLVVLVRPRPPTLDWTTLISTLHSLAPTSPPPSSPRLCARRLQMAPLALFPGPRWILPCQFVWPGTPRGSATLTVPVLATTSFIPQRSRPQWSSGARMRGTSPNDTSAWVLGV